MFSKPSTVFFNAFFIAAILVSNVDARVKWLERDGRVIYARRFGQEHPAVIDKISSACEGQVCGVLGGQAISTLLAAAPECSQQDMADQIIDAAAQFDAATQQNMIALAIEFRQVEKNSPPDFTTNPPTNRNTVFCQKPPKNAQLNGLVQAQDPANDPNVFFDPATKASVKKGAQANTFPFGTSGSSSSAPASSGSMMGSSDSDKVASTAAAVTTVAVASASQCPAIKTVTVTQVASTTQAAVTTACPEPKTVTVTSAATSVAITSSAVLAASSSVSCTKPKTFAVTSSTSATVTAASSTMTATVSPSSSGANLQKFTGALGGITPPKVTALGGGQFQVDGNSAFNNLQNAIVRSCDVQHNQCANKANSTGNKGDVTVDACGAQQVKCDALAQSSN